MQKQIDIVSQHKNLKDHKWPNIQVSSWPVREIHFEQKMQTDGFVPNIVFNRILLYLLDMCVMFFLLLQLFMRSFFFIKVC